MERDQKELINQNFPRLVEDIIPVDMLPYLPCLTSNDKEKIQCEQRNNGYTLATQELLLRLFRRRDAFQEFIRALSATGCGHIAELLYPREEGK